FVAYSLELGTPPADRLRFLALLTPYGLDDADYAKVATTRWTALEALAIDRCDAELPALQPLLDATGVPALRQLVLGALPNTVIARMAQSAVVRHLEPLELGWIRLNGQPEPRLDPGREHSRICTGSTTTRDTTRGWSGRASSSGGSRSPRSIRAASWS